MKVQDVMVRTAACCTPETNLGAAVEILWNRNCGILPVVANGQVTAVVTDRDLCIALGTRNRMPGDISVGQVARGKACCCQEQDELRTALETMAEERVRRLPVINKDGVLQGILSMDDVVLHAETSSELSDAEIVRTLKRIYGPQLPQVREARAVAV
jgi:CBS domain-containing protein